MGFRTLVVAAFLAFAGVAGAQEAPGTDVGPMQPVPQTSRPPAPIERAPAAEAPVNAARQPPAALEAVVLAPRQAPASTYDKAMFEKPIPAGELAFLLQFQGAESGELYKDKQFRRVMKVGVPDVMFHYGSDKPLTAALDEVLSGSRVPVVIREKRYVLMSGNGGRYLAGRGFLWVDMQDGIVLGGFYFHPTNGEPTPSVTVFSRQVKADALSAEAMPPAFLEDLATWTAEASVPAVTTRYFIGGVSKKILLEHDEDYCVPTDGTVAPGGDECEQMNVQAADLDESSAYFLDQTHYATNATAWMLGPDQVAFIQMRDRTCGGVVDPLGCHIRVTRERTAVILRGGVRGLPRK